MTTIRPVRPLADPPLAVPDPDTIRAAIDAADERAKLLRRLLRVAMRLHIPMTTGDNAAAPAPGKGVRP